MTAYVSVVIPTYDRPRQLRACLQGLSQTGYPRDSFEVVVVDDGGHAALDGIVEPFEQLMEVRLERRPNGGPASARNAGAASARGELLAFTDDDCVPEPDWLAALVRSAAAHPGHMIGGQTANMLETNVYSSASQHLISYLYEYSQSPDASDDWSPFFASNNLAVPKQDFERIGGFDVAFPLAAGEDREFCDRWSAHGLPMVYAPDARVLHGHRLTLRSFWRQQWNYGRGAFHFQRARVQRGSAPIRPQPLSFYTELLRYPLRHEPLPRGVVQTALLGLSQCANALGFFSERRRSGPIPATASSVPMAVPRDER